ncbi:hypothetical protein V6N12_050451 [Hibiscus sabdariffa]|uniref:Uncharacterized protein n=1 Tax=Hibiscus sabdariffa TaxID=183260 RepID=A0ABR2GCE8_9ROSI
MAAKTVPSSPIPTYFVALLTKVIQNQEAILHNLFVGDFSQLANPKAHSSTPSYATELVSPATEESAKTATPPESDEV